MSLSAILLLALISTTLLASALGQPRSYDLVVDRTLSSFEINRILLICSDASNGELVLNALFFRNGLQYDIPDRADIPGRGVRFVVDRTSEGNFTCGEQGSTSTPPRAIVARPESDEIPPVETFYADVGSTARLDCSIPPGAQLPLYYVTWRNASDPSVIFYQINPLLNNGQDPPTELSSRYTLDFQNFSLYISNVELADAVHDYQCMLGVVDPSVNNRAYPYTRTQDVNISLRLFKAPQFVEEPTSMIVLSGANVTFTCAVFSSPGESSIDWRLGSRILDRHDARFSITSDVVSMDAGMRTTSTLTIVNVTGFDSDRVECFSEYVVNVAVMVSTVRSEAVLSVLDEVELQPPIPFESGGFIFPIIPKHPLLIPVMVQLLYIDAENPTAMTPVQSLTTFYNTTPINVIAFSEQVPSYDSFYLGVALFYRDQQGPMIRSRNVVSRPGPEPFMIAFWVTLCLLIPLLILVIAAIVIQLCSIWCRRKSELNATISILNKTTNQALKNTIVCCGARNEITMHDGPRSVNGFTDKLAQKFVDAIVKAIDFGEKDRKILPKLQAAQVRCGSSNLQTMSRSPVRVGNGGIPPALSIGPALSDITSV